jgi:hypothetical protein
MRYSRFICAAVAGSLSLAPLAGCENLPGGKREQGTVIGGVGGAAAGAAVAGENNRLLGALLGGALGAGGGYLVGAKMDKTDPKHRDEAVQASRRAEANPARPEDVRQARTADLNNDGYVTLDEVAAMQKAGLSDKEMIDRLRATGQVFELTSEQENYLRDHNVGRQVIVAMRDLNQSNAGLASETYDGRSDRKDMGSERIGTPR